MQPPAPVATSNPATKPHWYEELGKKRPVSFQKAIEDSSVTHSGGQAPTQ